MTRSDPPHTWACTSRTPSWHPPHRCPRSVENVKRLEAAGIAAVVMHSLFEEQIIHESLELDHFLSRSKDFSAEASSYLPDTGEYSLLPEQYLEHVRKVKQGRGHSGHRKPERGLEGRLGPVRRG